MSVPAELSEKHASLIRILRSHPRVAVALSGGVDSGYLAAAAVEALGPERVLAITADSELFPRSELRQAREIAERLGIAHRVVPFDDLANPAVAGNLVDRCYHCKRARFLALQRLITAEREPGMVLLHGENADDLGQYRPGSRAAREAGAIAPLAEAGLTKADIRALARAADLPNWNAPSAACLATRFPYDTPLTREALGRVEHAEELLRQALPGAQVRVRDHHPIARLEVAPEQLPCLVTEPLRSSLVQGLRALGYRYVTLDLAGYQTGSFDDTVQRA